MNHLIPRHNDWNGNLTWSRRHESGLFALSISVHGEREKNEYGMPPRSWCSYLLGGDRPRFYRDGKPDVHVERCPVTALVFERGASLFESLSWNGGQTFFETKRQASAPFSDLRTWKIGDDHQHLWDSECNAWDGYDFEYIERRLKIIADEFAEQLQRIGIQPKF